MAPHNTWNQDSTKDHGISSDYARLTYNHSPSALLFAPSLKQKTKKRLKILKHSKSGWNTPSHHSHLSRMRSHLMGRKSCNKGLKVSWEDSELTRILQASPHQRLSGLRTWLEVIIEISRLTHNHTLVARPLAQGLKIWPLMSYDSPRQTNEHLFAAISLAPGLRISSSSELSFFNLDSKAHTSCPPLVPNLKDWHEYILKTTMQSMSCCGTPHPIPHLS